MNSKLQLFVYPAVAALSLAAAFAAHAQAPVNPDDAITAGPAQVFTATKTRAQVQTELAAARANGSIKAWSFSYNFPASIPLSAKTREQARAEVLAERDRTGDDYASRWYGEDSGAFYLSQRPVGRDGSRLLAAAKTAQ